MSRSELVRFMSRLERDGDFRKLFAEAEPIEILQLAKQHGFAFSEEIQGELTQRDI